MVIAEVKEDIRNLLRMFLPIRKWIHLMHKLPNTDSIYFDVDCMKGNFTCPGKISDVQPQKFEVLQI